MVGCSGRMRRTTAGKACGAMSSTVKVSLRVMGHRAGGPAHRRLHRAGQHRSAVTRCAATSRRTWRLNQSANVRHARLPARACGLAISCARGRTGPTATAALTMRLTVRIDNLRRFLDPSGGDRRNRPRDRNDGPARSRRSRVAPTPRCGGRRPPTNYGLGLHSAVRRRHRRAMVAKGRQARRAAGARAVAGEHGAGSGADPAAGALRRAGGRPRRATLAFREALQLVSGMRPLGARSTAVLVPLVAFFTTEVAKAFVVPIRWHRW
jgi:hypothetical protein